jgi:myo-inositol-1-phosphate synthase
MGRRVGAWIVGVRGAVSTCTIAGAAALREGLVAPTGLVTAQPVFEGLDLADPGEIAFGGYDLRAGTVLESAEEFARDNGVLTPELVRKVAPALKAVEVKPGFALNCGAAVERLGDGRDGALPQIVAWIQEDLRAFRDRHGLDDVVVVNLASAEAWFEPPREMNYLESFVGLLAAERRELFPSSALIAYAAMDAGFAYVNFTSSTGAHLGALDELARRRGVPHCGRDAKTGETLLKTVLAPMFVARSLRVRSWEGVNLLGNRDGQILAVPENLKGKLKDKDAPLRSILKDPAAHTKVRIDYVPSYGDWKTAWDSVQFEGFLGAQMELQFTWRGCDSALAAPLVLDLVRLAELARRRGEKGMMAHTACFWKAPYGVEVHDFAEQMRWLVEYAEAARSARSLRR